MPPRRSRALLLAFAISTAACGAPPAPAQPATVAELPRSPPPAAPAPSAEPSPPRKHERATAPRGYVEMTVVGLVQTKGGGAAVLLGQGDGAARVVPVFVGGTEALSIELRRNHDSYPRPLTHDLLDSLVRELGGELVKVQVDELRNDVFIGSVYVRRGEAIIQVDARPSDGIALALGNGAPIFVAQAVVDRAGVARPDEALDAAVPSAPPGAAALPPTTTKRPLRR